MATTTAQERTFAHDHAASAGGGDLAVAHGERRDPRLRGDRERLADPDAPLAELAPSIETNPELVESAPPAGSSSRWPGSREEAQVEVIVNALRGYRVLTRTRLMQICRVAHWSDSSRFRQALAQAVSSGTIRQLGDDLYEIAESSTR